MKNYIKKIGLGLTALGVSGSALAYDTTSVIAEIDAAEVAITAVGVALIGLAAVMLALRWSRGQLFGA